MQVHSFLNLNLGRQVKNLANPPRRNLYKINMKNIIKEARILEEKLKAEEAKKALRQERFESLPKPVQIGLKTTKEVLKLPYYILEGYTKLLEAVFNGGRY